MKYLFMLIMLVLTIDAKEYYTNSKDKKKLDFMDKAKNQVKITLKDNTINFKNIYFNKGVTGIDLVCGEYKKELQKDPYSKFVYMGKEFIFFENKDKNFKDIWDQVCKYDNSKTSILAK